ncbi:Ig-like domain repeat protein [Streptomyces sp. NPDC001985]|uniref:Ig-like domain repeat protein n=1 Tax=Streptomyces sp. NPDC001985 TaxID=3154406 RepID=UPI003332CDFB
MRRRSISTATALAVLFSSAALVVGTAGTASADSVTKLPVDSVRDFVVDDAGKRLYISTGNQIVVTDFTGKVVTSVPSLPGVDGLALSPDGGTLYAAVNDENAILAYDTATVTEAGRYPIGNTVSGPRDVAVAGGKIWFGYGGGDSGDIGSLDLSGAEPVVTLDQADGGKLSEAPELVTTPGAPNTLVVAETDTTSGRVAVYDISGGTAERTVRGAALGVRLADARLSPDGSRLITAASGNRHQIWRTSDLTPAGQYASKEFANSVAVAADGRVATGSDARWSEDVHIFPSAGSTKLVRSYDFPNNNTTNYAEALVDGGLAWDASGSRLFAVTQNSQGAYALRVLNDPGKSLTTVTVSAPAKATRAKPVTVSGKVNATVAFPAGSEVSVTRTDAESPKGKSLGKKKVASNGTFSFSDTPYSGGKVTYRAAYAGGAQHQGSAGSDSVEVSRSSTTLSLDNNNKFYDYNSTVNFTAKLGKTYKNRTVKLYADPAGDGKGRKLIKTGTVNSSGKLSAKVRLTRDTVVTADFAGDSRTSSKSAKTWVGTRVKVSTALTNHYKYAKLGNQKYHFYKKSKNPYFTTTMPAFKNRSERLTLEFFYEGKWYDLELENAYFPLDSKGVSRVQLNGPHETGYRLRMRSSYINGSSGDTVNSTTHGPWRYFTFTS